ncbi:hypothetical protein SAMN05444273_10187 [Litoreibacter ascidiaceicola]|uniref:Baseplate J-like protein n=1 Tax=Litoreibacter ascidiaceicola TaxID=1486859 RepID=A0A1M4SIG4_9RHOB|nr:hypothetical protein [Litoreibacter ascidiaceicola]SHE32000.1 hypothetical protein SAMN05444273_10187 [Litoreibacter ascidiaceicola]
MADLAAAKLIFDGTCPDCGTREQVLPLPIPGVEDDFDWKVRDYDSFRLFMMQELASRYPDRRRWTPADMEVVLVELLSAALDRASHALDRVQAERFLDTARRPGSVRRLLVMIGWQPDDAELAEAHRLYRPANADPTDAQALEQYWLRVPSAMERARQDGPSQIAAQHRMVTLDDHSATVQSHPLVALAQARLVWSGAWNSILIATLLEDDLPMDAPLHDGAANAPRPNCLRAELWEQIVTFHSNRNLALPPIGPKLTGRTILRVLIDAYRMIGSEVFLEPARAAPINVTLSVRAKPGFFRSELRQAVAEVFTSDQGGFFEPGRLGFGEALYASDIIEAAMQIEGVAVACLNRFRRVGRSFEDRSAEGFIAVDPDTYLLCAGDAHAPERGAFRITVQGGETG